MSPDIEWHVGEDAERETIAKTSSPRRSRRSFWAVLIVVVLGVGLGLAYRSIPEPPPKPIVPTPAPTVPPPTPTPPPIEEAIRRDAFQLANSAGVTFNAGLSLMPQAYADWYASLQNAYGRWGPTTTPTYRVYESGTLPSGVVWVNLGQFRNGDFFHHIRFYRLHANQWIWGLPDFSFWNGEQFETSTDETSAIGPMTIAHPMEDAPAVGAVFDHFTRTYLDLCKSLKCPPPPHSAGIWTPGLTLALTIQPALMQPSVQERDNHTLDIALPSPRVVGYYKDTNTLGDPYTAMAYATLIDPIVRLASGDYARWETDHGGELFLQAVVKWKLARVREELQPLELFYPATFLPAARVRLPDGQPVSVRHYYVDWLKGETLIPLDSLWNWPHNGEGFGMLQDIVVNEANTVVIFIEDQFGKEGVVRFLNALGRSTSLDEAIGPSLGLTFGEFNRQWLKWLERD